MASGGKKRTTMAKLTRESKLRERRADKEAKKNARKQPGYRPDQAAEEMGSATADATEPGSGQVHA